MSNSQNIGINCLSFNSLQRCGAEEVLINICKGFKHHGHEKELVFFCYKRMKEKLILICPKSKYVIFEERRNFKQELLSYMLKQTFEFHKIYLKYNLKMIFFANAGIGILKYNVPVIVLPHDIQYVSHPEIQINKNHFKRFLYKNYYKIFYKIDFENADKIVAISETDKKEIINCYPKYRNKVHCIYNPLDISQNINIEKEKGNYIIAVNIQYKHKNIITLIKAFEIVLRQFPDFELYLTGQESEWTQKLRKYTEENDLSAKVHFLGYINREELLSLWKRAQLYVNPSIFEGFGMTSAESILLGVPTLLSDLPVNREVTQGLCRYFDNYENANILASHILDMLSTPVDLKKMEENKNKLADIYDYKNISKKYWELFERVEKDFC